MAGLDFYRGKAYVWGYLPQGADELAIILYDFDYNFVALTHLVLNIEKNPENNFFEYMWNGKTIDGETIPAGSYYMAFFATAKGDTTGVIAAVVTSPFVKGINVKKE